MVKEIKEFEEAIEHFECIDILSKPFVACNTNGFCVGFFSELEAQKHIRRCRVLERRGLLLCLGKGECSVCSREEVVKMFPHVSNPCSETQPFGTFAGYIDRTVKVVIPLSYVT